MTTKAMRVTPEQSQVIYMRMNNSPYNKTEICGILDVRPQTMERYLSGQVPLPSSVGIRLYSLLNDSSVAFLEEESNYLIENRQKKRQVHKRIEVVRQPKDKGDTNLTSRRRKYQALVGQAANNFEELSDDQRTIYLCKLLLGTRPSDQILKRLLEINYFEYLGTASHDESQDFLEGLERIVSE